MSRFETETLTQEDNLKGLALMNPQWVELAMAHTPHRRVILDMDSSESPVHGQQEGAAYNGHFECVCYHPLFLFNQFGDCEGATLRVDQVWAADITYIPMAQGFLYLVAIMDWHSQHVLAWKLSNTMDTDFCVTALEAALGKGRPEVFNTDQGAQFTSDAFTQTLQERGIRVSMDEGGGPDVRGSGALLGHLAASLRVFWGQSSFYRSVRALRSATRRCH